MKSKIIKAVIACIVVAGLSGTGYAVYTKNSVKHISVAASNYYTASVKKQSLATTIQGTGTAYTGTTKEISANNSGTISGLGVKVGDTVTAGQTLFVSTSDDVQKSKTTAENNLSKQKLTLTSDETALADANSKVTEDEKEISEAESALSTAKANKTAATNNNNTGSSSNAKDAGTGTGGAQPGTGNTAANSGSGAQSNSTQSSSAVDSVTAAQNKLTQLQTNLKNDQNSVKSYTNLIVTDKIAVSEAEADLSTAKTNLSKMTVTSPIAGLVTAVNYSNGDSVQGSSNSNTSSSNTSSSSTSSSSTSLGTSTSSDASSSSGASTSSSSTTSSGSSVLTIVDTNSIKIKVSVDELDVSKIKVGQTAVIKFDAISGKSFTGTVEEVPQTGTTSNDVTTYDVVVAVNNPSGIKIGMSANAAITVESKDNALVIPADALVEKNNKKYVRVSTANSNNNTKTNSLENSGTLVEVKTGIETLDYIEVTSGLKEGQQVIVKSTSKGMFNGNMESMGKADSNNTSNSSGKSSQIKSN